MNNLDRDELTDLWIVVLGLALVVGLLAGVFLYQIIHW